MGLFSKKSRETMNSVPKLSALAQEPDLDILSPPPLPAAYSTQQQRSVSGASVGSVGSVSSLNEPKGYTLRGKLGLAKAPQNVFDGFDGAQVPDAGYNDSVYGDEPQQEEENQDDLYEQPRDQNDQYGQPRDTASSREPISLPHINTFVQHGTVKQYTPEFGGAEFGASGEFAADSYSNSQLASPTEFHSSRNSPVKPPPITIPGRKSGMSSPAHVSSPLGKSPAHVTSPRQSGMASAAAALAMGLPASYTTPPLAQQAQFGSSFESPQTFSTPSQQVETHPADHVNCSHGAGHTHAHAHNTPSPHVASPTVKSPPPPLAHPGYPKEHYIAKKKSSEALGEVLPGRDLYQEAMNDYPYPLSPSELQTAPYPTCYYNRGCRQIGPHSHEEEEDSNHVEPVFATFDQSKYDEIQRESREQTDKENIVWGQRAAESRDTLSAQSRDTVSRPAESADSRFADPVSRAAESRAAESADSRFAEADSTDPAESEYIPADLHRAESSIYPEEEASESRDEHRDEHPDEYSRDEHHDEYPRDEHPDEHPHDDSHDFDFNTGGTHTPTTTRLPLDSPGTPGTPTHDLSRDFNRLSVSQIKGMGLPLDTRSIASGEGHVPIHASQHHVTTPDADVNHGHVTHGQVVGGGSTPSHHVMLEPSQAEILRSSYISTDSGGTGPGGLPIGSTGHVMDRHMMSSDPHVMEGHVMDEIQIDDNGHVVNNQHHLQHHLHHSPGSGHVDSRSGTMMTNLSSPSAAYYPAPIPMNLKLPPLLSKKNRRKSRSGISPFPSPRKSSFTSALDKPGNRSSFMSPWSHTSDGSLLHYEGFADDFERPGRSVHRMSLGSRGSSPLKKLYLSGEDESRDPSRDVSRLSRDFDEAYGEYNHDESAVDLDSDLDSSRDPYYNPEKRGRRRTMSLTSINVNMDNSEVREEFADDAEGVEGDVSDMQRYEASANAFTRVHIDANAIVPPSAAAGYGNGISPAMDQKPGTLVEELELRKKDKKAVRGHLNKTMHQYAADGTEAPLIQQIHDSQSAYGFDDRRQSMMSDKRMSMMTGMTGMTGMTTKEHSYEEPNHHRMSLLALDSLAQMDYQQSYSKPGAAQISKQYKASRDDDEPLRVRKQRLKRQSQQLLEQRQLQENIEKQRVASVELEKKRQDAKQQRRNQFGVNAAAAAAGGQKKGKVLIGPGGEVIRT